MKTVMIGTSLCLVSLMASAGERVDKTIEAAKSGDVEIEHVNGYAKITGWDRDEVRVVGELGDRTREFIFEREGNDVLIKVKVKGSRGGWGNWDSDDGDELEIFIPQNSRVSYDATNANVDVENVQGGASIETVNGNIEAIDLAGRVNISSVNGDIESKKIRADKLIIETVNGDLRDRDSSAKRANFDSVNGDIEVNTKVKNIHVETVNGDMDLMLAEVEDIETQTVNGSIEVSMVLLESGSVRASSVGGSIDLNLQENVSARFDIEGHAGGRITNNLSDHKEQKAKYGPGRWLEFSLNGGAAKVDVSTVSGRIRLNKRK